MTTWRDSLNRVVLPDGRKLIGASFRGVPFFVATSGRAGGRRLVTHEFPLRDDPHVEDLGRTARTFQIDGYVVGSDYVVQRDALLSALEDRSDAGELVHPYFGVRPVRCASVTVAESIADGGMATFSIAFADAPIAATVPIDAVDFVERVAVAGDAAKAASADEFAALYSIAGLPGFALDSASDALGAMAAGLAAAAGPVTLTTQELATLTHKTNEIIDQAGALVRSADPADILTAFADAVLVLAESIADPLSIVIALLANSETPTGPPVMATTATRARELANQDAITAGLRRMSLVEAVKKSAAIAYTSIEEALQTREAVTDRIDRELDVADQIAYPALLTMRAALVSAVPGDSVHARNLTIEQTLAIPSILLAFRLYGDTDNELDLVARNNPRRPEFMRGTLSALSNV